MQKKLHKLLKEFVSIPSVSTDKIYKKDTEKGAMWIGSYAKKSGLLVKIVKGFDNPIVLARTKTDLSKQTILIYGHYDVQPAQKKDGWKTEPFNLTKKSGRLYGRGSADNKGQILTHLYSIAHLMEKDELGYNVIFMIEGNEETGSPNLHRFIKKYKKELTCDCIMISDGELGRGEVPALEASFRGVANIEVSLTTAKDDLHSGLFGGSVPNASLELSRLISKIYNKNKIIIPKFYDDIPKIKLDVNKKSTDLKKLTGTEIVFAKNDAEYETLTGLLPAIEITTLNSGYTGEGFRNSIPARASAKINIRSAPTQNPEKLLNLFKKFLEKNTPPYVKIKFTGGDTSSGAVLDTKSQFSDRAKKILQEVYKMRPVQKHSGGTLPIVNDFKKIIGVPQIMIPLANEDCGMHSASENISLKALQKGLSFSLKFFAK